MESGKLLALQNDLQREKDELAARFLNARMWRCLRALNAVVVVAVLLVLVLVSDVENAIVAFVGFTAFAWKMETALYDQHVRRLNTDNYMKYLLNKMENDYTGSIAASKTDAAIRRVVGSYRVMLSKAKAYANGSSVPQEW